MEKTLKSVADTDKFAAEIIKKALKFKGRPIVLALYGELGAGKTSFVKHMAKYLGVREEITSPTFLLMKISKLPRKKNGISNLVHIDAYRLDRAEELLSLGFEKILTVKENIIAIEWPEKLGQYLPKHTIHIYFNITGQKKREVNFKFPIYDSQH